MNTVPAGGGLERQLVRGAAGFGVDRRQLLQGEVLDEGHRVEGVDTLPLGWRRRRRTVNIARHGIRIIDCRDFAFP